VSVEFQDTGQGMSEEQRSRAFTSVLNTTKRGGTGLGLAIVARVIETHRGKIKIKSRLGEGTVVTILLPV
jgi:signal transduction histidine kinase